MANCFEEWKLVIAMVMVDFCLAIVNILFKKVVSGGMNYLLIITYRQAISALFLAPIACFFESKSRPQITVRVLCHLFISGLVGATLTQYFFLIGLKYTSATFTCAFINMVPVNTFLLALPFRLEKLNMRQKSGRAKVLGTLICITGAIVLTLYKGNALTNVNSRPHNQEQISAYGSKKWVMGSMVLTAGSLTWASWFLIQAKIGKSYPFQYSSTAIMSFFSAIQSAILYLVIYWRTSTHASLSAWILKGKLDILSVTYAGTVGSGLCYVVMSWCVKQRGPVFTSAFNPFIQIFVAFFDVTMLHEQIHVGSVLGSVLVISGMYILLWGKSKDVSASKDNSNNTTVVITTAPPGLHQIMDGRDDRSVDNRQITITN